MARGITEEDVHNAADSLVGRGERPTVERIRAYLGTGSPNTVLRWLDSWWMGLGARLQRIGPRLDLPQAPEPVAELAGQLWAAALEHAKAAAEHELAQEREALQAARTRLDEERGEFEREGAALREQATAALQSRDVAVARGEELERLVRRLEGQLEDSKALLTVAADRAKAVEQHHQVLVRQHQVLQERIESERESAASHVRATEDRASTEIDRARHEARDLKRQLSAAVKERDAEKAYFQTQIDDATRKASEALQEAASQRARAEAIQEQLTSLQHLPAALEAVLQQAARRPRPSGAKKPSVSSRKKTGSPNGNRTRDTP